MKIKGKKLIQNKTVIVSGASGGIGASLVKRLVLDYSCKVIGICRNEEKVKKVIEELGDKKDLFSYYLFDVSKKENWQKFKLELENKNIVPDVLINNAGFMLPFLRFDKISNEEIEEIINTNFSSVIYSTKALIPLLKNSKTPTIINISSSAGMCAVVGESMYCATKYAVRGFTETLMLEYKDFYIAGVYPGFIKTNILHRMSVNDKENKLIQKLMMPVDKATKKIIKGIKRRKKRIVMGYDGKSMTFFARLFPITTPKIVCGVLKKSKLDLFSNVFSKGDEIK